MVGLAERSPSAAGPGLARRLDLARLLPARLRSVLDIGPQFFVRRELRVAHPSEYPLAGEVDEGPVNAHHGVCRWSEGAKSGQASRDLFAPAPAKGGLK